MKTIKISAEAIMPFMPAKNKDAPDSELRSLLIVYGWEPSKEGAATWLMRIMDRLEVAENPPPATDTPGNTDAVEMEQPAGEWPKWTKNDESEVRVYANDADSGKLYYTGCKDWIDSAFDLIDNPQITRAEAVALIGEQAVAEGERLAGGAK